MKRITIIFQLFACLVIVTSPLSRAAEMSHKRFSFTHPSLPFEITSSWIEHRRLEIRGTFTSNDSLELSFYLKDVNEIYYRRCGRETTITVDRVGTSSNWQGNGLSFTVTPGGSIENLLYSYNYNGSSTSITKCRLKIDHLATSIPLPHLNLLTNSKD